MGVGYVIRLKADAPPLVRVGAQIGQGTNNIAEYAALLGGLRHALRLGIYALAIHSDSMLVVEHIKGRWKVRDGSLKKMHAEAKALLSLFSHWSIQHVRREENTEADALSRQTVWEEPPLPSPRIVNGVQRQLLGFQAAFVRYHWRAGIRNSYLLARVFGCTPQVIEHLGNGDTYKDASFDDIPPW